MLWWDYLQIFKIYPICDFVGFLMFGKSLAIISLNIVPSSSPPLSPRFPVDIWWAFLLYSPYVCNHLKNISIALYLWVAFGIFTSTFQFTNLNLGVYMSTSTHYICKLLESLGGTIHISSQCSVAASEQQVFAEMNQLACLRGNCWPDLPVQSKGKVHADKESGTAGLTVVIATCKTGWTVLFCL